MMKNEETRSYEHRRDPETCRSRYAKVNQNILAQLNSDVPLIGQLGFILFKVVVSGSAR